MSICYIAWCYQIHFPYFCVLIHLPTYLLSPGFPRPHQTGYMRSCLQYKLYFCNSYPICDLRFLEFFRVSHFLSCKLLEEIESMYVNKVAGLPVTPQAACWSSSTKFPCLPLHPEPISPLRDILAPFKVSLTTTCKFLWLQLSSRAVNSPVTSRTEANQVKACSMKKETEWFSPQGVYSLCQRILNKVSWYPTGPPDFLIPSLYVLPVTP